MRKVAIIGGGISGLSTAYNLKKKVNELNLDVEVLVIEAKPSLGGNIITERVDGFVIEGGPDCFLSEKPWAHNLCAEIGLDHRLINTNDEHRKVFILWKGVLHELPDGIALMIPTRLKPIITTRLISWKGKLRLAFEPLIAMKRSPEDESLGAFVRRRLGTEALDRIAEPLIAGIHAGDPETMSLRATFPRFKELELTHGSLIKGMLARMKASRKLVPKQLPAGTRRENAPQTASMFMSLRDGLYEVIERLTALIGEERIRTDTRVERFDRASAPGDAFPTYRLGLSDGTSVEADAVVFSTPAYVTAELTRGIDEDLANHCEEIPYVSTATVSLGYDQSDLGRSLDGFGFVVPRKEGARIMASTWTSTKFPHRVPEGKALIRCFVGGSANPELVDLDDEAMLTMVREELQRIMKISADPQIVRIFRWPRSMPQYVIGHQRRIYLIRKRLAEHPGLQLTGSAYLGVGISDTVKEASQTALDVVTYLKMGRRS